MSLFDVCTLNNLQQQRQQLVYIEFSLILSHPGNSEKNGPFEYLLLKAVIVKKIKNKVK